jgi:hypothetical protein
VLIPLIAQADNLTRRINQLLVRRRDHLLNPPSERAAPAPLHAMSGR